MPALAARQVDILLVEDNPADVDLTIAGFRDALVKTEIHTVKDGEEAIEFLKHAGKHAQAPRPDLVLLDLNLNDAVDGFQVLAEMKTDPKLRKIPVIIISGSERDEDRAKAYELQAAAYLVKPADLGRYFTVIRQIKELWIHAISTAPRETDATA